MSDEKILTTSEGMREGDDSLVEDYDGLRSEVTEDSLATVKQHGDDESEEPVDADDER